jgi:uncharacterized phage-associated protein
MTYSALVIAYAFVRRGIDESNPVTQMQLQKMVYFAHGYHYARYGEALINEPIQAWEYGPVIPSIYHSYKFYGSSPIITVDKIIDRPSDIDLLGLSASAKDAIDYTWKATSKLSAFHLSSWSHKDGSPWANVYQEGIRNIPIDNNEIRNYFKALIFAEPA